VTTEPKAPKKVGGNAQCRICVTGFYYEAPENHPAPTNCGHLDCRRIDTYTADDWAGAARMAQIRIDVGIPLNRFDRIALDRTARRRTA